MRVVVLSLVCPFYNEAGGVAPFLARVVPILEALDLPYEIVCVNDGSSDGTLAELAAAQESCPTVRVVDLSRNFGKEAALSAGLHVARGSAVIPIDADLQDPPEVIPAMVEKWREGFEVVLARRTDRTTDSWAKRTTARWFYRLINRMSEIRIPENVGDFRLLDAKVVRVICELNESRRFMKGLFAWAGFREAVVDYRRECRGTGRSKFTGWKLWNFALEGITSFSTVLLRIWTYVGVLIATGAFAYAFFIFARTLIYGIDVPGYASVLTVVLFLGGMQLLGLGMIGEYVGRTYMEAKRRPTFVIRDILEPSEAPSPRLRKPLAVPDSAEDG